MSIYPVRLAEWYGPRGSISWRKTRDKEESEDRKGKWLTIISIAASSKCCRCGARPKATAMIAAHSLPHGYYDEVWCSTRCFLRKPRTRKFERDRLDAEAVKHIDFRSDDPVAMLKLSTATNNGYGEFA